MIDGRVKLRHIRVFLEVARLRSFVGAADSLAVSQPAISKTLRELEEILGATLVERSRAGVFLTDAGEVFRHYAAAGMAALNQGFDGVAQGKMAEETILRVGVLPTVAARLAPQAVRRYKTSPKAAVISLETGPNAYLLERLRSGALDLVIGRLASPERMRDLSFVHLYSEPIAIVARPEHPLATRGLTDLGAIAQHTLLLPPRDAVIRRSVEQLLVTHGVGAAPDRIETVSNAFGRAYVRQSDAIWFISEGVVADDLADGVLIRLPFEIEDASGPVGLTLRAGVEPSPPLRMLMRSVVACAEALTESQQRQKL
ncbi:MAG: pca operon transcription factor PcaQ [Pseudomonadota bacterium]